MRIVFNGTNGCIISNNDSLLDIINDLKKNVDAQKEKINEEHAQIIPFSERKRYTAFKYGAKCLKFVCPSQSDCNKVFSVQI
jgi:hypothetical protein